MLRIFSQPNIRKEFPYIVTTAATTTPISIDLVKTHLRIPCEGTKEDQYLLMLIEAVTNYAERYTKRDFINKTYTTYRDFFTQSFELRKAAVSSITSLSYLVDGVFTAISTSVYGLEITNSFPSIYLKENQDWPTGLDAVPQAIKIVFVAGYGASDTSVPSDVKMGLLNHVALLYENRGDCSCSVENTIPANTKALYDSIRIMDLYAPSNPAY